MAFCKECGAQLPENAKFCLNCGVAVSGSETENSFPGDDETAGSVNVSGTERKGGGQNIRRYVILVCVIGIAAIIGFIVFAVNTRLDPKEQEQVNLTVEAIDEIGEVGVASKDRILRAEELYESLTPKGQNHVGNSELLQAARKDYEELRTKEVEDLIAAIGEVSLDSKKAIGDARNAYSLLEEDLKGRIANYDSLVAAEKKYSELAVQKCMALIDEIGAVTLDKEGQITDVKNFYYSLSSEEKKRVTNHETLTEAENELNALRKAEEEAEKVMVPGDVLQAENWEITLIRAELTDRISPNNTSGYYLYFHPDNTEVYVDAVFQIQNNDDRMQAIEDIVGPCSITYGSRTLTMSPSLLASSGRTIEQVYSWDGLGPLQQLTLHVVFRLPRAAETDGQGIRMNLTLCGTEKTVVVRQDAA